MAESQEQRQLRERFTKNPQSSVTPNFNLASSLGKWDDPSVYSAMESSIPEWMSKTNSLAGGIKPEDIQAIFAEHLLKNAPLGYSPDKNELSRAAYYKTLFGGSTPTENINLGTFGTPEVLSKWKEYYGKNYAPKAPVKPKPDKELLSMLSQELRR